MRNPLKYWFLLIFAKPGNGKSLEQARITLMTLRTYFRTEKRYPNLPHRILITNQQLSFEGFLAWRPFKKWDRHEAELWFQDHILYWESPEQFRYCPRKECWKNSEVHRIHDCDIFIDEGATLFPADKWSDTPFWLRKMWYQHRHNSLRIVMLTQDYKQIDINCRRMVWQAYYMKKVIGSRDPSPTLPPLVKWSPVNLFIPGRSSIWGLYMRRRIDPTILENEPLVMLNVQLSEKSKDKKSKHALYSQLKLIGRPEYHLITWRKINLYDTTQDVQEFEAKREIEHIQVSCTHPGCNYVHKTHRIK